MNPERPDPAQMQLPVTEEEIATLAADLPAAEPYDGFMQRELESLRVDNARLR